MKPLKSLILAAVLVLSAPALADVPQCQTEANAVRLEEGITKPDPKYPNDPSKVVPDESRALPANRIPGSCHDLSRDDSDLAGVAIAGALVGGLLYMAAREDPTASFFPIVRLNQDQQEFGFLYKKQHFYLSATERTHQIGFELTF